MPNNISHKLRFRGEWRAVEKALEALKRLMKTDKSLFDFHVLFPYPAHFKAADEAREAADDANLPYDQRPPDGYNHGGYEWCLRNWGTKWEAYDIGFDHDAILFQTANSEARPIFAEISRRFPDLKLRVEYANEDMGRGCGILVYKNGELIRDVPDVALEKPRLFARAIIGEQKSAYYYRMWQEAKRRIAIGHGPGEAIDILLQTPTALIGWYCLRASGSLMLVMEDAVVRHEKPVDLTRVYQNLVQILSYLDKE